MGNKNQRIFIYVSNKGWKDATYDIRSLKDKDNYYYIRFNSGKSYPFSYENVEILKNVTVVAVNFAVFSEFFGEGTDHVYVSKNKIYFLNERIGLSMISQKEWNKFQELCHQRANLFNYYSSLASFYDKDGDSDFLSSQYDKAKEIWNDDSVLRDVLSKKLVKTSTPRLIFPFPHNLSQMMAIERALSSNVSVIQGPPGTGKTQTILNLIANILCSGKTVAVISNNNCAVQNVYEKMDAAGYGFLCANLGNLKNRQLFFSQKHQKKELFFDKIDRSLPELIVQEKTLFINETRKGKLLEERSQLQQQFKYSEEKEIHSNLRIKKRIKSKAILRLSSELENKRKEKIGPFFGFIIRFRFGINVKQYQTCASLLSEELKYIYVVRRLEELDAEIKKIDEKEIRFKKNDCRGRILKSSKAFLNRTLSKSLNDLDDYAYTVDNFKSRFDDFIKRYPVILSSTYCLPTSVSRSFSFDYIIIDESSQSTITTVLPSLTKGKHLIVIGDDKQLPPVIPEEVAYYEKSIYQKYKVDEIFRDDGKSFLAFIQKQMPPIMPITLLREHYRCVPEIIGFSDERFYEGQLILERERDENTHLALLKTMPGNHARRNDKGGSGQYNQREIDEILKMLPSLPKGKSIGVITPYRRQAELLKEVLPRNIEIGTIHTFQGRECDIIILSTVANDAEDYQRDDEIRKAFVNDERMINVAVSRAKDLFILVTSDKIFHSKQGVLSDLTKYIRYQTNSLVKEGRIRSIFDLLYDDYVKERKSSLNRKEVLSEKLMSDLLDKIFQEVRFASLRYSMHVPLKSFLKIDTSKYSKEETNYLTHPWTHLDFVVFNRFDKIPILAIEVDGIAYHEQNEKQLNHDSIKNKCLMDCKLPLLRVKTNESGIEEKIIQALNSSLA